MGAWVIGSCWPEHLSFSPLGYVVLKPTLGRWGGVAPAEKCWTPWEWVPWISSSQTYHGHSNLLLQLPFPGSPGRSHLVSGERSHNSRWWQLWEPRRRCHQGHPMVPWWVFCNVFRHHRAQFENRCYRPTTLFTHSGYVNRFLNSVDKHNNHRPVLCSRLGSIYPGTQRMPFPTTCQPRSF